MKKNQITNSVPIWVHNDKDKASTDVPENGCQHQKNATEKNTKVQIKVLFVLERGLGLLQQTNMHFTHGHFLL